MFNASHQQAAGHDGAGRADAAIRMARLNYLADAPGRALFHTSDPRQSRMQLDPRDVAIGDARSLDAPSLDREGFQLIRQPLPDIDYRDAAQRDGIYLVMLQELIADALGASRVIADTSILRLPGPDALHVPVLNVHSDYTPSSARRLLEESWDQTLPRAAGLDDTAALVARSLDAVNGDRQYSRVIAVNAWRTISQPPHDIPLAVCARSSVAPEDIRVADFIEVAESGEEYRGELSLCRFNERHAWHSYSDMTPDEMLLFLGFDFVGHDPCGAMHSAFRDAGCPPGVPGRASVEVRAFAFFA